MTRNPIARALVAALLGAALSALARPALADIKDYAFELTGKEAKVGEAILAVRLVDKRNGKPVPDAVIFARRIDMAPDGMDEMTSKIEPIPSPEPDVYRFRAKLSMAGGWRLSLAAKVQGETGTVEDRLEFRVVK